MAVFKHKSVFAGRYELDQLIGEGGFSEVWKANDLMGDDAVVALKIYAPEKGLDEFGVKQFRKEFSITHNLSHPYLMKVYHFDISEGSPYLIMPYCQHGSLARHLAENGPFSEAQLALLMWQMGEALQELHSQEPPILHQDIKPDNILMQNRERFLLTDFGISTQTRHTLRKSTSSSRSLTVAYAPPERFDSNPVSNQASDIFSLGVSLYEISTGHIPWDGYGGQSLLKGAAIPQLPAPFPRELNRMLQACMALDPADRPTALQLREWGKHYLEQGFWRIPVSKDSDAGKHTLKQNLKRVLVPALILLAAIAIGVGFWLKSGSQEVIAMDQPIVKETVANTSDAELEKIDATTQPQTTVKEVKPVALAASNLSKELEKSLNQLSSPTVPWQKRKEIKQELTALFASGSAEVFGETEGLISRYSAESFLDLVLNIPHTMVVGTIRNDQDEKITELHLTMSPGDHQQ